MSAAIPTILIVDDVPTNIHILGDTLAADFQLHIATSGAQALQLAEQCSPDLILLDIMMPGMDGFEVLRRLRSLESLANVPVIFVTALEGAADESAGLLLGAADYITKPYNPQLVRLRVKNHLELARQRALLKAQRDQLEEQRDQLEEQRDQLERRNEVLQDALARVKRLEGIIPICMCCKKIRDNRDIWQQLENYITEHSGALFSHGLCPHCAAEQLKKTQRWPEAGPTPQPAVTEPLPPPLAGQKTIKFESVGQMVGDIAHDFNNILTGIVGNLSLAQMHLDPASSAYAPLKDVEKASERAVELTRQLLSFAKGGTPVSCGGLPAARSGELSVPAAVHQKGGTVLVMDDEQMIRTIATQMLQCLGYQVTTCENGSEAISLYQAAREAGTPFDAVIMDLTVASGMGGAEAARCIRAIDPEARLVVSSGYYNDPVMLDFRRYGFCFAMPKPYKTTDLSAVLSKVFQK